MILHHLLWPELPHKLQFLARQYTRHRYWKDEGAGWTIKNMAGMKIYNVKDCCVTLEIFDREMEEIKSERAGVMDMKESLKKLASQKSLRKLGYLKTEIILKQQLPKLILLI